LHILSIPPIWILPLKRFGAVPINTYSFLAFYSIYVDFPVETLFNPAGFSRPFYSVYAEFTVETDPVLLLHAYSASFHLLPRWPLDYLLIASSFIKLIDPPFTSLLFWRGYEEPVSVRNVSGLVEIL